MYGSLLGQSISECRFSVAKEAFKLDEEKEFDMATAIGQAVAAEIKIKARQSKIYGGVRTGLARGMALCSTSTFTGSSFLIQPLSRSLKCQCRPFGKPQLLFFASLTLCLNL